MSPALPKEIIAHTHAPLCSMLSLFKEKRMGSTMNGKRDRMPSTNVNSSKGFDLLPYHHLKLPPVKF